MLKRMRANPWGQLVLGIVGLMITAELVYQANSFYLRLRLRPMFEQAVAEAEIPEQAIFRYNDLRNICPRSFDICLMKIMNPEYSQVYMENMFDVECDDKNSNFCPEAIQTEIEFAYIIKDNIGLFSDKVTIAKTYTNGTLTLLEARHTRIPTFWRPNPIFLLASMVFDADDPGRPVDCIRAYFPTFREKWSQRSCP